MLDKGEELAFTAEHVVRRECRLLSPADYVVGVAIAVGHEAGFGSSEEKLVKDVFRHKIASSHVALAQHSLAMVWLCCTTTAALSLSLTLVADKARRLGTWYLGPDATCAMHDEFWVVVALVLDQFSFLLVGPLFAIADWHDYVSAQFCQNDRALYDKHSDTPCVIRHFEPLMDATTMDMLVTDKTGTLTTGQKVVAELHLRTDGGWVTYTSSSLIADLNSSGASMASEPLLQMLAMALCNSCETDAPTRTAEADSTVVHAYKYTSADDMAFVEFAATAGFALPHTCLNSCPHTCLNTRLNTRLNTGSH